MDGCEHAGLDSQVRLLEVREDVEAQLMGAFGEVHKEGVVVGQNWRMSLRWAVPNDPVFAHAPELTTIRTSLAVDFGYAEGFVTYIFRGQSRAALRALGDLPIGCSILQRVFGLYLFRQVKQRLAQSVHSSDAFQDSPTFLAVCQIQQEETFGSTCPE